MTVPLRFDGIPDQHLYLPRYSPWAGCAVFKAFDEGGEGLSLTSPESRYALFALTRQALKLQGEIWECGVHRGGTARMLARLIADHDPEPRVMRLFDTFTGSPSIDLTHDIPYPKRDITSAEQLESYKLDAVRATVGHEPFVHYHPGLIPASFAGLATSKIALAHIDVDLYQGVLGCCEYIYPRMVPGGFMIFDDYGYPSCPGARRAVDTYFADKPEFPLVSPSAQAFVFKLPN